MTFLVVFGTTEQKVWAKDWVEFVDKLNQLVQARGIPELIYLKELR